MIVVSNLIIKSLSINKFYIGNKKNDNEQHLLYLDITDLFIYTGNIYFVYETCNIYINFNIGTITYYLEHILYEYKSKYILQIEKINYDDYKIIECLK